MLIASNDRNYISTVSGIFHGTCSSITSSSNRSGILNAFDKFQINVVFIDSNLEDIESLDLISHIRNKEPQMPIIYSTRSSLDHVQPFNLEIEIDMTIEKNADKVELERQLLICKSRLIRLDVSSSHLKFKSCGGFILNYDSGEICKYRKVLSLALNEKKLLKFFIENPNKIVTREELIRNVWQTEFMSNSTLSVYINRLRYKVEYDAQFPKYIKTVRGIGYIFEIRKDYFDIK